MKYTSKQYERLMLLTEMEKKFDNGNESYFIDLLDHPDSVIRTRAVCILVDIASENAVIQISHVVKADKNALVRHESAFSLGQLGFASAINALSDAVSSDPSSLCAPRKSSYCSRSYWIREKLRKALDSALDDKSEEIRESATIALANLDYIFTVKRNNRFTKMTGG